MLTFIKGYLILSAICTVLFLLIMKYDCEVVDDEHL